MKNTEKENKDLADFLCLTGSKYRFMRIRNNFSVCQILLVVYTGKVTTLIILPE